MELVVVVREVEGEKIVKARDLYDTNGVEAANPIGSHCWEEGREDDAAVVSFV